MSPDRSPLSGPPDWSMLIGAVAAQRDRGAFAALFEHFAPRVKALMRRAGLNEGTAEELAQETLIAVWHKAPLFDPAGAGPAAWIFTIARNLRIDALRRERRSASNVASDIESEFLVDDCPRADEIVAGRQLDMRVVSALAKLPEEQMRVVKLSFYHEVAHAEIAERLRIPLGTVKSRLRLAMKKLQSVLGELA